jgi:hypothetical protein
MAMTTQDKRALKILASFVAIFLAVFWGGPLLDALSAGSAEFEEREAEFLPLKRKLDRCQSWHVKVQKLQKDLQVEVSKEAKDKQKDEFVKAIENLCAKSQVKYSRMRPRDIRSSTKEKNMKAFQLDCAAPFPNLIKFVKGIEELTVPVVIDKITLSEAAKSKQGPAPTLNATFDLRIHLFPEALQ